MAFLPSQDMLGELLRQAQAPIRSVLTEALVSSHTRSTQAAPPITQAAPPATRAALSLPSPAPDCAAELLNLEKSLGHLSNLPERLGLFARWLETQTQAGAVFVADADGLSMVDTRAAEHYIAAAGPLGDTLDKLTALLPTAPSGSVAIRLAQGEVLELVKCDTPLGGFVVGLISTDPVDTKWITVLPKAVEITVSASKGDGSA